MSESSFDASKTYQSVPTDWRHSYNELKEGTIFFFILHVIYCSFSSRDFDNLIFFFQDFFENFSIILTSLEPSGTIAHTSIAEPVFDKVATSITQILDVHGFAIHPTIKKMLEARRKSLSAGKDIDWATAEALAFGSLMEEGKTEI